VLAYSHHYMVRRNDNEIQLWSLTANCAGMFFKLHFVISRYTFTNISPVRLLWK